MRNVTISYVGQFASKEWIGSHIKPTIIDVFYMEFLIIYASSLRFSPMLFASDEQLAAYFDGQGTVVVAGRARAVVVGVGTNTAMGSIRDSMLQTEDVSSVKLQLC